MAPPEVRQVLDMSASTATALIQRFQAESSRRDLALAACVVDRGGSVVAAVRMDGAQLPALELAYSKAFTAVAFGAPSSRWSHSTAPGGTDWGLAGVLGGRITPVAGGVPLFVEGALVGALGVSGTASSVDEDVAAETAHAAGLETAP